MLFEKMKEKDSARNPVFTAIDTLTDTDDIRKFAQEYEDWMVEHGEASIKGREREVARSNIGYILGYYSDGTAALWYKILPEVSHPIFGSGFGRGKVVTLEEALEAAAG